MGDHATNNDPKTDISTTPIQACIDPNISQNNSAFSIGVWIQEYWIAQYDIYSLKYTMHSVEFDLSVSSNLTV